MSLVAPPREWTSWQSKRVIDNGRLHSQARLSRVRCQPEHRGIHTPGGRRIGVSGEATRSMDDECREYEPPKRSSWLCNHQTVERQYPPTTVDGGDFQEDREWKEFEGRESNGCPEYDDPVSDENPEFPDASHAGNVVTDSSTSKCHTGNWDENGPEDAAESQYPAGGEPFSPTINASSQREPVVETSVWEAQADRDISARVQRAPIDGSRDALEIPSVRRLVPMLWDVTTSNQQLFRAYRDLPSPGLLYLSKPSRGLLLRRFADPPERHWIDARRFHALLDDMLAAGLPVSRSLWTSGIRFAGQVRGKVLKKDLQKAIGIWNRMEHVAGLKSDETVFNILFSTAVKAGHFTVADRLLTEMRRRKIVFGRPGKISLIYYQGMLRNDDGIRHAFEEFVKSGEYVDTAVMNCLLVSFLRAGNVQTAEELYARMIEAQQDSDNDRTPDSRGMPRFTVLPTEMAAYRQKAKKARHTLKLFAPPHTIGFEQREMIQKVVSITPDTRTFQIMLSHYALHAGDMVKVMFTVRDMERTFAVPPRAMIFLYLFEGFSRHGGKKKNWSRTRLRNVWKAYVRAVRESKTRARARSPPRDDKLFWENPLEAGLPPSLKGVELPTAPSGHYVPLPGAPTEATYSDASPSDTDTVSHSHGTDTDADANTGEGAPKEASDGVAHEADDGGDDEESVRLVENGVFPGRRIIIAIVRAFAACCSHDEMMDVWFKLEKLWRIDKRSATDVMAVNEELERLWSKAEREGFKP